MRKQNLVVLALVIFLFMLLGLACKKDTATDPEDNPDNGISSQKMIGAAGGKVEDSYGASITIPANALTANKIISVRTIHADSIPEIWQSSMVANIIECLPSGTSFQQPVAIILPVTSGLMFQPGDSAHLCIFNPDSAAWEVTSIPAVVMPDGRHLRAQVTHFSGFGTDAPGSFGGEGNSFSDIHHSIDLTTAAQGWAYHFMQGYGPIGEKKRIRDCCFQLQNVVFNFNFVSPSYSDHYTIVYGEQASCDRTEKITHDEGTPADGYHMRVDGTGCWVVCDPDFALAAARTHFFVPDDKGKTAEITATVRCGTGPGANFTNKEVALVMKSGPGRVDPPTAQTDGQGVARGSYTVERRGVAVIQGEVKSCPSQKTMTTRRTVSVTIDSLLPDHIYANVDIHHGGENMPWTFHDKVEMMLIIDIDQDNVTLKGGEGSHYATCTASDAECSIIGLSAPAFTPTGTVTKSGNMLAVAFNPNLATIFFTYQCDFGGGDGFSRLVPAYSFLVSSIIAKNVRGAVKMELGSFIEGSGSESFGEDLPLDYEFEIVYGTKTHP
ncbi:MAG TPA: hypothetical protein PK843_08660 [bacterium]|nr:hypothetical protein [bacterium]HPN34572.1 hypothetical protein [bacterium]